MLQTAKAITSGNLTQPDDSWITQLLRTHYECSRQYNLRQFSLTRVQKCTPAPSEIENAGTIAAVFIRAKGKSLELFAALQQFKIHESFVVKVYIPNDTDVIEWIGIIPPCLHQRNWTLMNAKFLSGSLKGQKVQN